MAEYSNIYGKRSLLVRTSAYLAPTEACLINECLRSREMLHHVIVLCVIRVYPLVSHDTAARGVGITPRPKASEAGGHIEHVSDAETPEVWPVVCVSVAADVHVVLHAARGGCEHGNGAATEDIIHFVHIVNIRAEVLRGFAVEIAGQDGPPVLPLTVLAAS